MGAIVDAHHHLWPAAAIADQTWRPDDHDAIDRAFEIDEFASVRAEAGVTESVLMQSVDSAEENRRLFGFARRDPAISGVVAWAPLEEPIRALATIDALLAESESVDQRRRFKGVRCLIGRGDLDWILQPRSLDMFRAIAAEGLVWDVVPITRNQVNSIVELGRQVPELRIVVDHLAAPPVDNEWGEWRTALAQLAGNQNTAIKLSIGVAVLSAIPSWDVAFLKATFGSALDAFGPTRSMLGSNWPVIELRTDYATAWRDSMSVLGALVTTEEQAEITSGTAIKWYALSGVDR